MFYRYSICNEELEECLNLKIEVDRILKLFYFC